MSSADPTPSLGAAALLSAAPAPRRWWRSPRLWVALAVFGLALLAWWFWSAAQQRQAAPVYQTEPLLRGTLTRSVTANGSLQPVRAVNIGSELSGTVRAVHVDINDRVRRGQVLIELDAERLQDQVRHGRAALAAAHGHAAPGLAAVRYRVRAAPGHGAPGR